MHDLRNLVAPFLAALWRGRWAAMALAWLVCLAGWAVVAMLPDRYTARAEMFVDTDTLLSPLMRDLAVTPDFDRQVDMMRQTVFSVPNLEELIARTGLDADIRTPVERAELIDGLTSKLYLSVLGRNLFEIGFHHGDPETAYRVVEAMLDIFVQQNIGHSQRDVEAAGDFIAQQLAAYDLKLREAELRVAQFQREHSDELGGAERNVRDLDHAESEVRRLNAELESAHWRRDQLRLKLDSTPRSVPASQAGQSSTSPAQQQLAELNRELSRKLLIYTEQHPDILALRQLIAQAAEQVRQEQSGERVSVATVANPVYEQLTSQLQVIEVSIDDLTRRLHVAEQEVAALSSKVRQAPQVEADLKRLNRDYDVLLSQYEQLTQRRESAQLARDLDEGRQRVQFRTVDPPVLPLTPSGPPHGLMMMAVLVLGVGAGVAFVIGRFLFSETLLTTSQLRAAFSLPVLGGIAEAQLPGLAPLRLTDRVGLAGSGAALLVLFVTLFYFYAISPDKPDLAEMVAGTASGLISKEANADP